MRQSQITKLWIIYIFRILSVSDSNNIVFWNEEVYRDDTDQYCRDISMFDKHL